jgi:hypothetical protein
MAKADKQLYDRVRGHGVRKRVARLIAESAPKAKQKQSGKAPELLRKTAKDLRAVAETLEERANGDPGKRQAGARKAASTRKANAEKRSRAAKRGANTRAKGRTKSRA